MGVVCAFAVSVGVCARSVARVMLRSEVRSPPWYTFQVRNQELVSCLCMRVCVWFACALRVQVRVRV